MSKPLAYLKLTDAVRREIEARAYNQGLDDVVELLTQRAGVAESVIAGSLYRALAMVVMGMKREVAE